MKKLVALLLAVLMCVGVFAGCGNKSNPGLEDAKEYLDTVMKSGSESTPADYALLNQVTIGKDKYTIEWSVNVSEGVKVVVAENGDVSVDVNERTPADIAYVLTATIKSADGKTITATYNLKVPAFKELTWAEFTP
jgi:ABC-type glycerol-3-phosphate transport system substrate-binding protein